jgi:hypothetical protein
MKNNEHIVRYTAEEIDEMLRPGESQTNWARFDAMTEEELQASIDHDEEGEFDLSTVQVGIPGTVAAVNRAIRSIEYRVVQGSLRGLPDADERGAEGVCRGAQAARQGCDTAALAPVDRPPAGPTRL